MQHPTAQAPFITRRRPPRPITGRSARVGVLLGFAVAFAGGCDSPRDTMLAPDASPATLSAAGAFAGWSSDDAGELQALLKQERERTRQVKQDSKDTYAALKDDWRASQKQGLVACRPLPYEAESEIVGPRGGVLNVGPHKLVIPAGALTKPTVITGEIPVDAKVSVKFSPHGLNFVKQPTLVLQYRHCEDASAGTNQLVYVSEDNAILERPRSVDDAAARAVTGEIGHFSKYGVATGRSDEDAGGETQP